MFDVIVTGARCAGSPLSMLLARKGYRVLLVDKARFPSDTISTHVIWQAGLARARRWGLLEGIVGLGAPPIRRVSLDVGEFKIAGSPPPLDGIDFAIAPRRIGLDKLLLDAASRAGAEVRENFYVNGLVTEAERVTGIRGRTGNGTAVVERARMVVGADGVHSLVAHEVGAAKYNAHPSTSCGYYAYWRGGPPVTGFEIHMRAGCGGAALPTSEGLTCIVASWIDDFSSPEAPPEQGYRKFISEVPQLSDFPARAERVTPVLGMRELPGFFRKCWGSGWALAGDAAYHKHPLSAQGITDAFRDADQLSEAIDAGLSGRRGLEDALAEYERQRQETVMPMYESTCARARLDPPDPQVVMLFRALRNNQPEADRFFGTEAGTVSITEFFAPANLERIVRSAQPAAAGN